MRRLAYVDHAGFRTCEHIAIARLDGYQKSRRTRRLVVLMDRPLGGWKEDGWIFDRTQPKVRPARCVGGWTLDIVEDAVDVNDHDEVGRCRCWWDEEPEAV